MEALKTMFAPAERATEETIRRQVRAVLGTANLEMLYNAVNDMVLILNRERQIVFANRNFLNAVGLKEQEEVYGRRQGEILHCIHASEAPNGCGTTEFCRTCGANRAILGAQKGIPDIQECRILQEGNGDAIELLVRTSPLKAGQDELIIYAARDISHEKRRRVLERIFFHDIMNTAVGVRGLSELLNLADPAEVEEFRHMIYSGAAKMVDEIKSQRDLTAAENNELTCNIESLESTLLLKDLVRFYTSHEAARGKHIEVSETSEAMLFSSDKTLVTRVIGNMIKNGLEASHEGETVTVGCDKEDGNLKFWVHNSAFMPLDTQLQIFQRSFSTKGVGRGLGTYSMRLLTERYLKGSISFRSTEETGTTFWIVLPRDVAELPQETSPACSGSEL